MKRLALLGLAGSLGMLIAGCPIYDDNAAPLCDPSFGGCGYGGSGDPGPACLGPSDCGTNETCGTDNECHPGNCTFWGCVDGYECVIGSDQTATCEPIGNGNGGNGGGGNGGNGNGGSGNGGSGGDTNVYCGNPDDCGVGETCGPDGTCQPGDCNAVGCIYGFTCDVDSGACEPANPAQCGEDLDCTSAGIGYKCVSGICTAPEDQCFDQTQCGAGKVCAEGKCIDDCNDNNDCEASYTCNLTYNLCTDGVKTCTITNDCGSADEVCVEGICVPRADMGTCDTGFVWVENGCIPDQSANFICNQEGVQDACAAGSICLQKNCYISCEAPNQNACSALPSFNICKPVTTSTGTYNVCGSDDNLGGECDPVSGLDCPVNQLCIDGFCK